MIEKNCTLCCELIGKEDNNLYYAISNKKDRIIKETQNFVVIPTIGQIVEGYLLIVTKIHYPCIGALPSNLFKELVKIKNECREILYKTYKKKSIIFEHGAVGKIFKKRAGCCTDHAHLHIVPVEVDLLEDIKKHYRGKKIKSLKELRKQYFKKSPYLFYENNNKEMYLFNAPLVVSQYLRKILAKNLKKESKWDWRICHGKEEMLRTIKKLKGKL